MHIERRNLPLAEDVTIQDIASMTTGFTGADLANLVNEAALLAGRNNQGMPLSGLPDCSSPLYFTVICGGMRFGKSRNKAGRWADHIRVAIDRCFLHWMKCCSPPGLLSRAGADSLWRDLEGDVLGRVTTRGDRWGLCYG